MFWGAKGEAVSDTGAEVRQLLDNTQLIIFDSDGQWWLGILSQDVHPFQGDCQSNAIDGLGEIVHQWLTFILGVNHNCCVIDKQHVSVQGFTYFGLEIEYSNNRWFIYSWQQEELAK